MRSPLTYLFLTKLKNQLKSVFKSPGKIIYLVFLIGLIVVTVLGGNSAKMSGRTFRDLRELTAGVTVFYSAMFILMSYKGFGNGASMFSMADVNLIFPAPFPQRKVLFYGLFQQMGTSLLLGVFVLFQYSWLHSTFNVGYGVVLLILLGYAVTVFFAQITAMVIYAFTSSDDGRKRLVKAIYFAVIAAFVVFIAAVSLGDQMQIVSKAVAAVNGPVVGLFPVSGWVGRAVAGALLGNTLEIVFGLALSIVCLVALVCLIVFGKQDFYEDVLKSSEVAQSAITARKEGRVSDAAPSRVRLGKTGIGKGFGASVFYYKHTLENRRSRLLILEPMSLTFAVITIVMAVFMRKAGLAALFPTATIFQIFTVALGRFNKELLKPYIYLIPEPPLKKMLYALAEMLPSAVLEALLIFIPVALIMGAGPLEAVLVIAARISFAFLFTAVNIVVDRLWGGSASRTTAMLLYFVMLIAMIAPGIVLAVLLVTMNPFLGQTATAFLSLTVCNVPIALLALFLCRNMLQYAELNQR
jgi:hypothetical protein